MLHKTKGIVLHTLPYNDKYIIINMYTEEFGRISYMVTNSRRKKAKIPHAFLMPLSVLDMEVEHLNNREIQRIREARPAFPAMQLHQHPVKNAEVLFLSEVLYRVIQEKEANKPLFNYLYHAIRWLEIADEGIANFHLAFLFRLSSYLGIHPNKELYAKGQYFDMLNGTFSDTLPEHNHYLDKEESLVFARLLKMNFQNMSIFNFSRTERTRIIRHILDYYRLHLSDFPEIKSFEVMQTLFNQ